MDRILLAAKYAKAAHSGQTRKDGVEPYIRHPMRVAGRVALLPMATAEMVMAAWLHDTIEDTQVTYGDINEEFGPTVANLVLDLTSASKRHSIDRPRRERKQYDRDFLKTTSDEVKRIKLVDRIDNLGDMAGQAEDFRVLYAQETVALLAAIGDADPELAQELEGIVKRWIPET